MQERFHMRWYYLLVGGWLAALAMAASCSPNSSASSGMGVPLDSRVRTIDISGAEFAKQYDLPRSKLIHADYIGMKEDYHYLAIYQPDVGNSPKLQLYLRTPKDQLPASFPDHPQKPIQPVLTTQQAAEIVKPH